MSLLRRLHMRMGHVQIVITGLSVLSWDKRAKGHLYRCSCGRVWAE